MIRKRSVPTPEKKSVVVAGKPVRIGTRNVAPNIAAICWKPSPIVKGQLRRSSGATTSPDLTDEPSPWSFQVKSDMQISFLDYRPRWQSRPGWPCESVELMSV
jgi:hypothetical protein